MKPVAVITGASSGIGLEFARKLAKTHNTPVVDFADHDADKYFTIDSGLHLSSEGWVRYDRVLDGFFHGQTPDNG